MHANIDGNPLVEGGTLSGNDNGFFISGAISSNVKRVTANDNRYSALSFRSSGTLNVRDSGFITSGYVNMQVWETPPAVDLGTASDPGKVWHVGGYATD